MFLLLLSLNKKRPNSVEFGRFLFIKLSLRDQPPAFETVRGTTMSDCNSSAARS